MNIRKMILGLSLLAGLSMSGTAAPGNIASQHIDAVAAGDVSKIMADYGDKAVFQWVGGPLDGVYSTRKAIQTVWSKFAKGNAPLKAKISQLAVSGNPKGETISANVVFSGKKTIKVRYIMTYRQGKLVNEVWQIDPKLATSY